MKLQKLAGATSEIWQVFIRDSSSTTGGGLTGLVFNTGSLTAYYHRDTDTTATVISLVTMTVGTFTSSGFKEVDSANMPGWYQFCPPNAALASGAKSVAIHLKGAANMAPMPIEVQLLAVNLDSATSFVSSVPSVVGAVGSVTGLTASNLDAAISSRSSHSASDVWAVGTRLLTAGTNIQLPSNGLANVTAWTVALTGNITGNLSGSVGSVSGAVGSVTGNVGGNVTGSVGSVTGLTASNLDATISSRLAASSYTAPLDAAGTRTAVGLASANLDTQLDALPTNAELAAALGTADDAVLAAIAALTIPSAAANAAALLASAFEGAETVQDFIRLSRASLYGKANGLAGTTAHYRDAADTKNRLTATVDADGNRLTVSADPS